MRRGPAFGVLLLTLVIVAAARGMARWREQVPPASRGPVVPAIGLRFALSSADLDGELRDLARRPVWRGLIRQTVAVQTSLPASGPAGFGLYDRGWIVALPSRENAPPGRPAVGRGPWRLVASSPTVLGESGGSHVRLELPDKAVAATIVPGAWMANRFRPAWAAQMSRLLDIEAAGRIVREASGPRERWELRCDGPCALDILDTAGEDDNETRAWAALPDDAQALVWGRLSPEKLAALLPDRPLEALEGVLGTPVRSELGAVLAGTAVFALLEEPPPGAGVPRVLACADLANPTRAREIVERLFAIGVLTHAVDIGRYRGAWIGVWASEALGGARPALAVDGPLLLVGTRASDVRDAIDRRRRAREAGRLQLRIAGLGRGAWKAWSRSSFVTTSWEEIVTRVPGMTADSPSEVTAVIRGSRADGWLLESVGEPAAFAADPLLPVVRSALRALDEQRR